MWKMKTGYKHEYFITRWVLFHGLIIHKLSKTFERWRAFLLPAFTDMSPGTSDPKCIRGLSSQHLGLCQKSHISAIVTQRGEKNSSNNFVLWCLLSQTEWSTRACTHTHIHKAARKAFIHLPASSIKIKLLLLKIKQLQILCITTASSKARHEKL